MIKRPVNGESGMRKVLIAFAWVGLTAAPAFAGIAKLTNIPGTFSAPSELDAGNGLTFAVIGIESLEPPEGIPYKLGSEPYDNWPSIFGGASIVVVCQLSSATRIPENQAEKRGGSGLHPSLPPKRLLHAGHAVVSCFGTGVEHWELAAIIELRRCARTAASPRRAPRSRTPPCGQSWSV